MISWKLNYFTLKNKNLITSFTKRNNFYHYKIIDLLVMSSFVSLLGDLNSLRRRSVHKLWEVEWKTLFQ